MANIVNNLQRLDRRYLYALLILCVVAPFFLEFNPPVYPTKPSRDLFNMIQSLPEHSFVLLGIDWSAGTRGENLPETEAIMRHLMLRHLRFGMLAYSDPQGKTQGENAAIRIGKEFGYREGIDWVNIGFKVDMNNSLKAMDLNVPGTFSTDIHGNKLSSLPVMAGVHTAADFSALIDITATSSYQTYIQFVGGPYRLKTGIAVTAVMAPESFNYLDSGQIKGLLQGLSAAAEYETLVENEEQKEGHPLPPETAIATKFNNSSSFAHLLIILMIILGNAGMLIERASKRREQEASA
ncbi:MAG: hypothetical protein KGJ62_10550 [Armatimonadetes bacterium]|nr:hypothetical protein [Armatimonadota bacterium]MDE2207139.1 hypothetical protein [Armatimonadota bacterium]